VGLEGKRDGGNERKRDEEREIGMRRGGNERWRGGEVAEKRSIREETEREERVGHGEINGRACYSVITQPS
jgi:hypothetical protein